MTKEKGIHELYAGDSQLADEVVWGRKTDSLSRRGFLGGSGLAVMSAVLGACSGFRDRFRQLGGTFTKVFPRCDLPFLGLCYRCGLQRSFDGNGLA